MALMGENALSTLSLQQQKLQRLQHSCSADKGDICYSVHQDFSGHGANKEVAAGLKLGYGFTENFSAGLSLDRTLHRDLPEGQRDRHNSIGAGIFAQWRQNSDGSGWYLHPAVAFDHYKLKLRRPVLPNTEPGEGESQVKGTAYSLTTGQNFLLENGRQLGWFAAIRHSNLRRNAYEEHNAAFPVRYGELRVRDTAAAAGVHTAIPLGKQLLWQASAEVEQHVAGSTPVFTASAQYVGGHSRELEVKKTRASFSTGLSYRIGPSFSVGLGAHVGNGMFGKTQWGTSLKLAGQF